MSTEAFSYPFTVQIWRKEALETFLSYIFRATFSRYGKQTADEDSTHKFPYFMFSGVK